MDALVHDGIISKLQSVLGMASGKSSLKSSQDVAKQSHRIHGAAIHGNIDPINIPPMLAYIPYMDPMGILNSFLIRNHPIYPRPEKKLSQPLVSPWTTPRCRKGLL